MFRKFLSKYQFARHFNLSQAYNLVVDYTKKCGLLDGANNECIILNDELINIFKCSVIYVYELRYIILGKLNLEFKADIEALVVYTQIANRQIAQIVSFDGCVLDDIKANEVIASNKLIHLRTHECNVSYMGQVCSGGTPPPGHLIDPALRFTMPHSLRDVLRPHLYKQGLCQSWLDLCNGVAQYILCNKQRVEDHRNPNLIHLQSTDLGRVLKCNIVHREQIQEIILSCLFEKNKSSIKKYNRIVKLHFIDHTPERNWRKYLVQGIDLHSLPFLEHFEMSEAPLEKLELDPLHSAGSSADNSEPSQDACEEQLLEESKS